MKKLILMSSIAVGSLLSASAAVTTTYNGNGNTGFGGPVGTGSLQIQSLADGTLNFTWTRGSGDFNDALVIYIDSVGGGFSDTASFNDQADALRSAISGASQGSIGLDAISRSILTFNAGFTADYAFAANTGFGGLWGLNIGGDNSLNFITTGNLSPTGNASAATYTWNFNVASIGLTPNSGESFKFVATYLNAGNSFRSDETFGFAINGGNPGNGGIDNYPNTTATSEFVFTTIPEPSTHALLGLAVGFLAWRRKRR